MRREKSPLGTARGVVSLNKVVGNGYSSTVVIIFIIFTNIES